MGKLSYWIGLFCVAVLVLMPDINVIAQPDPGGQGSNEQKPKVVGQGTDTQTLDEQTLEDQTSKASSWTEEENRQKEQLEREVQQNLLEAGCRIIESMLHPQTGELLYHNYECPAGFKVEGLYRETEQSLIESGCQHTKTETNFPLVVGKLEVVDTVLNFYKCPPGSKFGGGGPYGGKGGWMCLVSPDSVKETEWYVSKVDLSDADTKYADPHARIKYASLNMVIVHVLNGEVRSGECVPPLGQGGLRGPTQNGQSPREVDVEKIPEPASSDSQVQSDQQQATGDQQQADEEAKATGGQQQAKSDQQQADEEAKAEGNRVSNQSQDNDDSKKGYGCSASS